jgi:hypothetical protein
MSRSTISTFTITHDGTQMVLSNVDSVNGNQYINTGGQHILYIANTSTVSTIATVHSNVEVDGSLVAPNRLITVSAATTKLAGPFPASVYNQDGGVVFVDCTPTTGVNLSVFVHGS